MKVKKLVQVGGRYVERYVDCGPSRAIPLHGRTPRSGSSGGADRPGRVGARSIAPATGAGH